MKENNYLKLAKRYLVLQRRYLRLRKGVEKFLKKKAGYKELRDLLKEEREMCF